MLKVLRQRNFSLLWFGQFISIIGDYVLFIALPFYTYNLTGSVLATGAMFMISTLPRLFLGSLAGVFADRWDRKRTMILADLLRVFLIGMLLFVRTSSGLWIIYVSAFLESIVSQFFYPAKSAIIPLLVDEKDLLPANSLNGLSDALTRLLGSALGGVLMGWLGFASVVALDSATFLFSAIMIALIVMPRKAPLETSQDKGAQKEGARGIWQDLVNGFKVVKSSRELLMLFIVFGVALLGDAMITVLIVPLVKDIMGGGAELLGWMMMAQGAGGLLGGLLMGKVGKRFAPRRVVAVGMLFTGLFLLTILTFPHSPMVLPLMAFTGVVVSAWLISSETMLQLGTSDEYRGRVFGTLGTTMALANLIGMFLASSLTNWLGLIPILIISGSLYFSAGILAWFSLPASVSQQAVNHTLIANESAPSPSASD